MERATTDAERDSAGKELAKWQTNKADGLAEFAEKDKQQEALVEKLLGDDKPLKEMLITGGARGSRYGQAAQIYTAIRIIIRNASRSSSPNTKRRSCTREIKC